MSITQHTMSRQTFCELHDQYRDRLLNSMTAEVRNRDAAEDITGAAFAAALRNLDSFRGESSFYTWVHAIALNEIRSAKRNTKASPESIDAIDAAELAEPDLLAQTLERSECCLKLRTALRRVPVVYRRILVDHFVRGDSIKRIAQRDRIPAGTVLSRIFTGKRLLRAAWEA